MNSSHLLRGGSSSLVPVIHRSRAQEETSGGWETRSRGSDMERAIAAP